MVWMLAQISRVTFLRPFQAVLGMRLEAWVIVRSRVEVPELRHGPGPMTTTQPSIECKLVQASTAGFCGNSRPRDRTQTGHSVKEELYRPLIFAPKKS